MVKVLGPTSAPVATGTVADAIQFIKWRISRFRKGIERSSVGYVRGRSLPLISRASGSRLTRETMAAGVSTFHNDDLVDPEARKSWTSAASGLGMHGLNRYVQKFIENNPQQNPPWVIPSPE